MWHEQRHQLIRDRLSAYGRLSIDETSEEIGVSRETLRRDFMAMEKAGLLRRVRGGVVALTREDTTYQVRATLRLEEKRLISQKALELIDHGMTLFIDAGTTSRVLAEVMAASDLRDLTILTNAFDVARILAMSETARPRGLRALMLCGDVRSDPLESWGAATINDISRYHADVALLAPWGVDATRGAMNYFIHGSEIARAMVRNADRTFVLADHSKVGAPARSVFCPPDEISHLIVDRGARTRPEFAALEARLPSILVA